MPGSPVRHPDRDYSRQIGFGKVGLHGRWFWRGILPFGIVRCHLKFVISLV